MWFKETVSHKKKFLSSLLKAPLVELARNCAQAWEDAETLTQSLHNSLCKLPHCQLLYAIDARGQQLSGNITRSGIDNTWRGQDLSNRPYLQGILPFRGLILSAAYLSQRSMQPCITAIQSVRRDEQLLGFIAADFHIKDLPNMSAAPLLHRMRQLQSGQTREVSAHERTRSQVDQHIDYLIYVLSTLMQEHGIFHCTLHFTSACAGLWSIDDPLNYQILSIEELLKPELFLRYPKRSYDCHTRLDPDKIPLVFAQLKALRESDDNMYLRSGSVNIINARIGLTFSSDGSQYMSSDEFLNHDIHYWISEETSPEYMLNTPTPN